MLTGKRYTEGWRRAVTEQRFGVELGTITEDAGAFDAVLQLADIARPRVGQQSALGSCIQAKGHTAPLGGLLREKPPGKPQNVVAPVAQGWNP